MLRNPELYFIAALCVLANSSVVARPAKNTPPVAPPPKQAPVRTDLTPRDKNECLAVAQTLNEQAKRLSQQTKRGIPREFTRVASDLDQSCGAEDFKKAWSKYPPAEPGALGLEPLKAACPCRFSSALLPL
jgi:hypothetical protein